MLIISSFSRYRSSFKSFNNSLKRYQSSTTPSSSSSSNRRIIPLQNGIIPSIKNPWKRQIDPNGSGETYWWNPETNENQLGGKKPQYWIEVQDLDVTTETYWWNPETNQTTYVGSPKPKYEPIEKPRLPPHFTSRFIIASLVLPLFPTYLLYLYQHST